MNAFRLLFLAVVLTPSFVHGQVDVKITPERESYGFGEPVILRCEISNETENPVEIDLGNNDAAKLVFILHQASAAPATLVYDIHHGGFSLPGNATLAVHEKAVRYVVLDQWFRPSRYGTFQLECLLPVGGGTIPAPFNVRVGKASQKSLDENLEAMVRKSDELANRGGNSFQRERLSYRLAIAMALSYLGSVPGHLLDDFKRRHDNSIWRRWVEEAEGGGPGGCNVLD